MYIYGREKKKLRLTRPRPTLSKSSLFRISMLSAKHLIRSYGSFFFLFEIGRNKKKTFQHNLIYKFICVFPFNVRRVIKDRMEFAAGSFCFNSFLCAADRPLQKKQKQLVFLFSSYFNRRICFLTNFTPPVRENRFY